MRLLAAALLLLLALAGCSDSGSEGGDGGDGGDAMPTGGSDGTGSATASGAPTSPSPAPAPAGPTTHGSVMRNNQFVPADLTVRVGDTVRWTTEDVQAHNVVSESEAASFRSEDISTVPVAFAQEFSHTFTQAGSVDYLCEYHPGMVGTITVVE